MDWLGYVFMLVWGLAWGMALERYLMPRLRSEFGAQRREKGE